MVEIEFSVMVGLPGTSSHLLPLMEAFEKQSHVHVKIIEISWAKGWTEIVKFGIFANGPDVSSIGTTWIGSLAAMQTLRPFTPQEIRALGGAEAFFEPIWRSGFLPNDPSLWATPWLGDAMVIYYWKDVLERAGITDLESAVSAETLADTLKKLRQSGCGYPLAATTANISIILHEAAHWLWNAGGDILSADGRHVAFNQPAALEGFRKYFGLKPYISPESFSLSSTSAGDLFRAQKAAVHIGSPWMGIVGRTLHPEWNGNLGIQVPGTTYVGGNSLVIWRYSRNPQAAFELIRFLSSQPSTIPTITHSSELPTKRDAICIPGMENDVFHHAYMQAMQTGRIFPTMRLWGSVEDKLVLTISNIWKELFANPDQDLDTCLHKHLDPLAERLNIILEN